MRFTGVIGTSRTDGKHSFPSRKLVLRVDVDGLVVSEGAGGVVGISHGGVRIVANVVVDLIGGPPGYRLWHLFPLLDGETAPCIIGSGPYGWW